MMAGKWDSRVALLRKGHPSSSLKLEEETAEQSRVKGRMHREEASWHLRGALETGRAAGGKGVGHEGRSGEMAGEGGGCWLLDFVIGLRPN